MKTVIIQIALAQGYRQPPLMQDWEAIPTQIPGLYLTRPSIGSREGDQYLYEPASTGWDLTHKSGWTVGPMTIKSLPKAKALVAGIGLHGLNWEVSIEEMQANHKVYIQAIREAWEATQL